MHIFQLLVRLRHYLNSRRLSCQTPPKNRGFGGGLEPSIFINFDPNHLKNLIFLSKFLVQNFFFDFVEYSTGSEYSIKNRVYHILTEIKVFWSGHKGLDYHQYLLNLIEKSQNCDYIIQRFFSARWLFFKGWRPSREPEILTHK